MERHKHIAKRLSAAEILSDIKVTNKDLEAASKALHSAYPGKYPAYLEFKCKERKASPEEIEAFLNLGKLIKVS